MTRTPASIRLLTAFGAASILILTAPAAAQATEPERDQLSEDTYGGVTLGEGAGSFPVDSEFDLMLAADDFEIPDSVEIWALSPEGGSILIGSGETESETYQNPGSDTYPEISVELIEVNLPSAEIPTSEWYAFTAVDSSSGDLITWTAYPVALDDDPRDFVGQPTDIWPVPDHNENTEPSSDSPTLEVLTEDTYGLVSILRDEPVIPLDQEFTVEVETSLANIDLWLLPPGGEEAVFLPAQLADDGAEYPQWSTSVSSEDVEYNGIYGLVATNESDGLIGWTPFGLSADGESLQPGDPGVHETEAGYSDRSIWPIPDSVAGPDEGQTGEGEAQEPEDAETESPEPTETPEPEDTEETEPTEFEETSDTESTTHWIIGLAIAGGVLIIAGLIYLVRTRRSAA
ncbi:hypothetical protein [Nesterenkonia muleiensis]|uniref:hypothetical protein n=1 Tax=Nesterenkonia muleiensis TaxID=2282648 RepID=UPI000E77213E|nr:hypothetical protein [Nesterenkonia muleiensis]